MSIIKEVVTKSLIVDSKNNKLLQSGIPEIEDVLKTVDDEKFRLQNKRIFLTYKDHLPKEHYIDWFRTKIYCGTVTFIRLAHETGDKSHNYNHTHVLIEVKDIISSKRVNYLDYLMEDETGKWNIHPNIKLVNSMAHFDRCKNYLAKEDKENDDLKETPNIVKVIWEKKTLKDALLICKSPMEASGIKVLWENRPKVDYKPIIVEPKRPFQQEFLKSLGKYTEVDLSIPCTEVYQFNKESRKINWIIDDGGFWTNGCTMNYDGGNVGKSHLLDWLTQERPQDVLWLSNIGRVADVAENIRNVIEEQEWNGKLCVLDLARNYKDRDSIYTPIENILDGKMTGTKFRGKSFYFPNKPKVWVSANFAPDCEASSEDRWNIFRINADGEFVKMKTSLFMKPRKPKPVIYKEDIEDCKNIEWWQALPSRKEEMKINKQNQKLVYNLERNIIPEEKYTVTCIRCKVLKLNGNALICFKCSKM